MKNFTEGLYQFYEFGAFRSIGATVDIWATNSTLVLKEVRLEVSYFDLESEWRERYTQHVELKPNQTTEILSTPCPEPPLPQGEHDVPDDILATRTHSVVISARLVDTLTGDIVSRSCDWPQPYKYIDFPDPELKITRLGKSEEGKGEDNGDRFHLSVLKPAKGVVLSVEGEENARFSDNGLDLVPGDNQEVSVTSLNGRKLFVTYMGKRGYSEVPT